MVERCQHGLVSADGRTCCAATCRARDRGSVCGVEHDRGCFRREGGVEQCCAKVIESRQRRCVGLDDTGCILD